MTLIDGKAVAAAVRAEQRLRAETLYEKYGVKVGLAVVLIGNNAASAVYVRNKVRACEEAGIRSFVYSLPEETTQEDALALIKTLARDKAVHGILVQLPLPKHLDERALLAAIPAEKDVDGFSAEHVGRLALGEQGIVACTPLGIMELLKRYDIPVAGKRAVIIGRSNIVGRPLALLLLNADATVTVCHSKTADLRAECLRAELLIAALGKANFVTADMVKEGATVIDVGMNRLPDGRLCGDVDFQAVKEKASYLTPVPGGVGPMTVAMLLKNVCDAAFLSCEVDQ